MFNTGSIFFGKGANPPGGGGEVVEVLGINGIYVDDTFPDTPYVELGGALGTSQAVTAELGSNREIVMPSNVIFFSLDRAIVNGDTRIAAIIPSDPFIIPNLGGFTVQENITTFGASQRKGYSLFAIDSYNTMVWLRRSDNDGFYFGTSFGNRIAAGVQNGITFFDSEAEDGNHISVGLFDTDTDDGLFFQVKGTMSLHNVIPISPPDPNQITALAIDQLTNQVQAAYVQNGLSVSGDGGFANYVLGNDVGDATNPAQFYKERQILTNGYTLDLTDLVGGDFYFGSGGINGVNSSNYTTNYAADHISFSNPTGSNISDLNPVNLIIADTTGAENIQSSTTIELYNVIDPTSYTNIQNQAIRIQDGVRYVAEITPGEFDAENTITHDYAHLLPDELIMSNGVTGGGSSLNQTYLGVNAPPAAISYGVADFFGGGITTDNPGSPGSQGSVWEFGTLLTGGAYTLDSTSAAVVSIGGVLRRVALLN